MYEQFFGLTARPFSLLPEANFLYLSQRHQHIVNLLDYGIESQAGFIVITGEVGAGKTTVIRHFMARLPRHITLGLITNPSKRLGSLLSWVASAYDLPATGKDEAALYHGFVEFLLAEYAKGRRTVLIIDEAQNLTPDLLEELRMLSNVNNEQDQLLQVILAGQPELLESLNRHELRQFAQRIAVHGHLAALTPGETAAYIRYRLQMVGGRPEIFGDHACAAVYFFTEGMPRLINMLCDQALIYAFGEEQAEVSTPLILEVVADRRKGGLSPFRKLDENQSEAFVFSELGKLFNAIKEEERKRA
jgi:general secretion pathway protein A